MTKLRVLFVVSLLILCGIFIAILYLVPSSGNRTESKRVQIIKGENGWTLQYDLINSRDTEINYTIIVTVDSAARTDKVAVQPGRTYTYTYHIAPDKLAKGDVTFTLYEGGIAEPIEETTYHIGDAR